MSKSNVMYILIWLLALATGCGKGNGGNNDIPQMTFDDVQVNEGNSGTSQVAIKLVLNRTSSKEISVRYSTIEGTAKAGEDFTAVQGQLVTFQPNEKEKTVHIQIIADEFREADETFQVKFDNPSNVFLLKGTATVTIKNDDTKVPFSNTGYEAQTNYPGYTLVWSDEFNGTELDNSNWTAETGDGCPNLCGWGNNELQYYMPPPNNVFFQDGKMIIEARAETYGGKNYTSTRIKTQGKRFFKFGRVDIRAILPKGKGIWPAFWMLPQDNVFGGWPGSGEIDIMELIGSEPSKAHATVHFGPGPGSINISRTHTLSGGATYNDAFHVFSMEWEEDTLRFYVDDILYSTVTKADLGSNTYPFNESFYFLINLAVGGNWPGAPDANTTFPQWLIVDYIRIYQK
jgi:Beta-glucanase/Beta-glucan synthetase